jgi:PPOX class probable F420-dependent enzyme
MTPSEVKSFLSESLTATLTTLGRDGWPHSTAMWFVPGDDYMRMWTYAKSQKAVNLRRDARFTLLTETGTQYNELRGVMIKGTARILDDFEEIRSIGMDLHGRYVLGEAEGYEVDDASMQWIEQQARKRVGLVLPFDRLASWDHRKI